MVGKSCIPKDKVNQSMSWKKKDIERGLFTRSTFLPYIKSLEKHKKDRGRDREIAKTRRKGKSVFHTSDAYNITGWP